MTPQVVAPLAHGGDLAAAREQFPGAPEPFIDLSTGINPHPYPLPALGEAFCRLPERTDIVALCASAAEFYRVPSAEHVAAGPGVQILLPFVHGLVPPGRAAIWAPTYGEHARIARLAGHAVVEVGSMAELAAADLAVVVNPNNPDGRLAEKGALIALAAALRARGGLLLLDESFMDVCESGRSLADAVDMPNLVVLRSFGKFFGLAGLRLGFALAAPALAARIKALLGPWPVCGPAVGIGEPAMRDRAWAQAMRAALKASAHRLDALLQAAGLRVIGGTALFQLVETEAAAALFELLGRAGILVRRFDEHPAWLRFGLPGDEAAWTRLAGALARGRL